MGTIINEQRMLEENVFKFENRIKSPINRFSDKKPTFVSYYHIDNEGTTVDRGFSDVENVLGDGSPIRYKKISNFPLYGLESINIQLEDGDQGLDGSYSSEAIILPSSLKPLQNDYFTIPYLKDNYIFRVTEVSYDNIMPDNYYKISFMLEYIDADKEEQLEKQTTSKFNCIFENMGTEEKIFIEDEYVEDLKKIDEMYSDMVELYLNLYYNERYNCLLADVGEFKLYDPLMSVFINKNSLFNRKNDIRTIILSEEFDDPKRKYKYEKSFYRYIERRDMKLLNNFKYTLFSGVNNVQTSFNRWEDRSVKIIDTPNMIDPNTPYEIIPEVFRLAIKDNGFTDNKYKDFLVKFLRKEKIGIKDIPDTLNDELLIMTDTNIESFFYTPAILYAIKTCIQEFMKK